MKRKTNGQSLKERPRVSSRKHLGGIYVHVVLFGGVIRTFRKLTAYESMLANVFLNDFWMLSLDVRIHSQRSTVGSTLQLHCVRECLF